MSVRTPRVRAPEPRGSGGWINLPGSLSLADLRGKVVLLDFWTLCCINCIHIVEELRALEERFADELVVIGVHSPKFPHEADHAAVVQAVQRHRIMHPVIDDPESITWDQYGVRAWPTLVLIDPEGYVVGSVAGEGHAGELGGVIQELVDQAESDGVLRRGPLELRPAGEDTGTLAFPGKVAADPSGTRIAIADTGHDRVLVATLDGEITAEHGGFDQPQGVRFDGDALVVCDTVAGKVWRVTSDDSRELLAEGISSPWDVVRDGDRLVVCEAGRHRLWEIPDGGGAPKPLAGTGGENLEDGPAASALLAQPSGITRLPDGALAFADSEVSALRVLRDGQVETLVGLGLFEWGRDDGDRLTARLQHPLGVAAAPGGAIYVADTFNSLLRVWRGGNLSTLYVGGLDEPGGLDLLPDGRLVVADTNHHRVVLVDPSSASLTPVELGEPSLSAAPGPGPTTTTAGRVAQPAGSRWHMTLDVDLDGYDLDTADGPPIRLNLTADPPSLLGPGSVTSWSLDRLPADVDVELGWGSGRIDADLVAATCSGDVCRVRRSRVAYDVELT
jgi:thiol-disulfide isomerase/thioredoxin